MKHVLKTDFLAIVLLFFYKLFFLFNDCFLFNLNILLFLLKILNNILISILNYNIHI